MIKYIKRVGMIIIYVQFCMIHADEWTWFYPQLFDRKARIINAHKKELFFKKENVHPFTQLLLSWNVMRPEKGFFSFYIQVRNVQTKQWGDWYLMANWGNGIQKTYLTKSDGLASCVHVRLELDHAKMADAFCIKVEPHDGAQLNVLDAIAVAVSDFSLFQSEQCDLIMHNVKSAVIPGMPTIAQFAFDHSDNSRICSPVSCAMVVQYLTGNVFDLAEFIAAIFDEGLGVYGSWQCNVAHMFDACKGKMNFFVRRANSFMDIYHSLEKNMPVIVSVRGELPGALKPFPHGHLMVIVGWDQAAAEVICHDPAAEKDDEVVKRYPIEPFLRAWERSHRLMYIVN